MDRGKIKRNLDKRIDRRAGEWLDQQSVKLGKDAAEVVETGTPGVLWARLKNGRPIKVRTSMASVPSRFDLRVHVGRRRSQPSVWYVMYQEENYDDPAGGGELGYHHEQHEEDGPDRVNLDRKQITARTVRVKNAAAFKVQVFGDTDLTINGWKLIPNKVLDLSSYVPTEGALYVGIESNDNGALSLHAGTAFAAAGQATPANYPVPAVGKYSIARVLLFEGQTALLDEHIHVSMPPSFHPQAYSSATHVHSLDDLDDVNVPSPDDGEVLTWNAYAEEWQAAGQAGTMVIEDLTSQIPAASDHFDLSSEATGVVMLFFNGKYEPSTFYTMDVDNLGLTTDFSPVAGDTLVVVYGVGVFATINDERAIHDNVAGEINAITTKAAPVKGDQAIIEDSEDGYAKKSADLWSLVWNQIVNESGSSFSNWSGDAFWSSDGAKIIQSQTSGVSRASYTPKIPLAGLIYEAEVQQKTDASGAEAGLVVGFDGSGSGGVAVNIRTFNDDIKIDQDAVANAVLLSATGLLVNTWYTLRLVVFGNVVSVYLDGTCLGSGRVVGTNMNATYLGLRTYNTAGWFRNIKVWSFIQP